ncbi:MAG: hypothetical protein Q8881_02250, partial [Sweet potato little leaf phytoplasma]|nr:hypothetical protein [Sweet potato little leaf phytoplasma]
IFLFLIFWHLIKIFFQLFRILLYFLGLSIHAFESHRLTLKQFSMVSLIKLIRNHIVSSFDNLHADFSVNILAAASN